MAVQQSKKSKSRKGMRRSHDALTAPQITFCTCGEPVRSHRVCANCGTYNGRQVVEVRKDDDQ